MLSRSKILSKIITNQYVQIRRISISPNDQIKKIASDLIENKDDIPTLKYLIKYKYAQMLINNYNKDMILKNVIHDNVNISKVFKDFQYGFYEKYDNKLF